MNNNFLYRVLIVISFLFYEADSIAQCTNGSQPECQCETADILCSSNELNGYTGSMSTFSHPGDGPTPICGSSFPDNPNWFGFVAWCSDLNFEVTVSNCTGAGVQMALFTDCTFDVEVACDLNCNAGTTVTLDLTDLDIGDDYFLLIDGCTGSACDYVVSVSPIDCDEIIAEWDDPIAGEIELCVGDEGFYDVESLIGAIDYHWFLDGSEVQVGDDTFYDMTWNTAGVFELCADVSNVCVDVDSDPPQSCIEITVLEPEIGEWINPIMGDTELCVGEEGSYEVDFLDGAINYHWTVDGSEVGVTLDNLFDYVWNLEGTFDLCVDVSNECVTVGSNPNQLCIEVTVFQPEAGNIFANPDDLCPGEISTIAIFDFSTEPGLETVILVTNPDEDITEILPPEEVDITSALCGSITVCSYTYDSNLPPPMLGENITDLDCVDNCCELECIEVSFDDNNMPDFLNTPTDMVLACYEDLTSMQSLEWEDNCDGMGIVDGVETGTANLCQGGVLTRTWTYIDGCENVGTFVQTIDINPTPPPMLESMPDDFTVACGTVPDLASDIEVSNGGVGACIIMDVVSPTMDGDADICGGLISFTWMYMDDCNNMLTHTQDVTVDPASEAVFDSPPADMTLPCSHAAILPSSLAYTNGEADCLIEGSVMSTIQDGSDECGGFIIVNWTFTDDCDRTIEESQTFTIESSSQAAFSSLPSNTTMTCNDPVPSFTPLDYSNGDMNLCLISGSVDPVIDDNLEFCGGDISATWTFTDACDRTIQHVQVITKDPVPEAAFVNPPPNMTMSCVDYNSFSPVDLMFSNNLAGGCLIEGSVPGMLDDDITECGGTAEIMYEYTDDCDRTIMYVQNITVEPALQASFTSLPMNMTLGCEDVNTPPGALTYTNGSSGTCLISGSVDPIQAGSVDECGGTINYIYTFTDNCNRTINHTQIITYSPASEPTFIDPPDDGFIGCEGELPDDLSLEYDNFEGPPCNISGEVEPEMTQVGNIITLVWNITNDCSGLTISHTQMYEQSIVVDWEEEFLEVNICSNGVFDLSTVVPMDLNSSNPTITYHDGFPTNAGNQITDPMVMPVFSTSYFISGINSYNCFDFIEIFVDVENVSIAGSDNMGSICSDDQVLDLFDFIADDGDFDGDFFQISGPSLNISDPDEVNIGSAMAGVYGFEYTIEATDVCPSSTAIINIEIYPDVSVSVINVSCSTDFETYVVEITNNDYDIDINAGEYFDFSTTSVTIGNIPIGTVLVIDLEDVNTECESEITITPPNCDCPDVEAPVSNGNEIICFGDPIPFLSVNLSSGTIGNWYDEQIGGSLLLANSTQYMPLEMTPGLYTYYVDAESIDNPGCLSDIRIPVSLEIISAPEYDQTSISLCDIDTDGILAFDSLDLQSYLNINATETILYYSTFADAQSGTNPLMFPIINSTPFSFSFFGEVTNSANCSTIFQIDLSIFEKPEIDLEITNVSCFDLMDGSIIIQNYNPSNEYFLDDVIVTESSVMNLSPDIYEFIMSDEQGCRDTLEFEILEGLLLEFESFSWVCSDNGTNTDPTDDFYTISFVVINNQNNQGSFNVNDSNANTQGPYSYGQSFSFTIPADGTNQILTFVDVDSACSIETEIGPLTPCSTDCIITVNQLDFNCNNGGTPASPDDDFYELLINASAINGSATNLYNVAINGVISYSFMYDQVSMFQLPADGTIYTIGVSDAEDLACTTNQSVGPLEPCSNECILDITISNIYCDGNGTGEIADDDVFYFTIFAEGANLAPNFVISEIGESGMYNQEIEYGPFLVIDGDLNLTIADELDSQCFMNVTIEAPSNCSDCPQNITAGSNQSLSCMDLSVMLMGNSSDPGDFSWVGPGGSMFDGLNPDVFESGTYYLTAQFDNGCILVDSVSVTESLMPSSIDFTVFDVACTGDTDGAIMINNVIQGTPPFEFTLDGVVTSNDDIDNLGAGTYLLSMIDGNNCILDTLITIEAGQVLSLDLPANIDLELGETGLFQATTNLLDEEIESIQWNPQEGLSCDTCLTTELLTASDGIYTITITSTDGCMISASINVSTMIEEDLIIPNVFSPNGDGTNDYFTIFSEKNVDLINSILIYDRWGELVYSKNNFEPNVISSGWDGRFRGRPVSPGVYVYVVNYTLQNGFEESLSSDITILR